MFTVGINLLLAGCLQLGVFAPLVALGILPRGVLVVTLIVFVMFVLVGMSMMEHDE